MGPTARVTQCVIYTSENFLFLLRPEYDAAVASQIGLITSECCQLVEGLEETNSSFNAVI